MIAAALIQVSVAAVAFHPTEPRLISGDLHGVLQDWRLGDGQRERTLEARGLFRQFEHYRQGGVRALAFASDGTVLYAGGFQGTNANQAQGAPAVVPIDMARGTALPLMVPSSAFNGPMTDLAVHPAGFLVGAGSSEAGGALWFWKAGTEKSVHTMTYRTSLRRIDLDSSGQRLAAAAFGDSDGQRGGNGRRLNQKGEYIGFNGEAVVFTFQPPGNVSSRP